MTIFDFLQNHPNKIESLLQLYVQNARNKGNQLFVNLNTKKPAVVCSSDDTEMTQSKLFYVPIALQDNICTADMPTTCGSAMLSSYFPPNDSTIVSQLKQYGAYIIGKTKMHPFGFQPSTQLLDAVMQKACLVGIGYGRHITPDVIQNYPFLSMISLSPNTLPTEGLIPFSHWDSVQLIAQTCLDLRLVLSALSYHTQEHTKHTGIQPSRGITIYPSKNSLHMPALLITWFNGMNIYSFNSPLDMPAHTKYIYEMLSSTELSSNLSRIDGIRFGDNIISKDTYQDAVSSIRGHAFPLGMKQRILWGNYVLYHADSLYTTALQHQRAVVNKMNNFLQIHNLVVIPLLFQRSEHEDVYKYSPIFDVEYLYNKLDNLIIAATLASLPCCITSLCKVTDSTACRLLLIGKNHTDTALLSLAHAFETTFSPCIHS